MKDAKCKICQYRKNDVEAVNFCKKCDNLHLCQACTEEHARTKATSEHTVTPLHEEEKLWVQCDTHDSVKKDFCQSCGKTVCKICILLEHGDHDIQTMEEAIRSRSAKVRVGIGEWEVKVNKLVKLEEEMVGLKKTAELESVHEDALIGDIECHASKVVAGIVKQKEQLIEQVRENYRVIRSAPEYTKEVSGIIQGLKDGIEITRDILLVTENCPFQLEDLISLYDKYEAMVKKDGADAQELHNILKEECQDVLNLRFIPTEIPEDLGRLATKDTEVKNVLKRSIKEATSKPCGMKPPQQRGSSRAKKAKVENTKPFPPRDKSHDKKPEDFISEMPDDWGTIDFEDMESCLSRDSLACLSPDKLPCLSPESLSSLPPGSIPCFSPASISCPSPASLPYLSPASIPCPSPAGMPCLSPGGMTCFSPGSMTCPSPAGMPCLSPGGMPCLSPQNLSPDSKDYQKSEDTMQNELKEATTSCMAIINSKYYAIAPPREDTSKLPNVIAIYEFPGTLKRVLQDNVYPVFDMSPTPDGKLAVLSLGERSNDCAVKIFDLETGVLCSISGVDIAKPMSLGPGQESECATIRPYSVDCVFRIPLTHKLWSLCSAT